MELFSIRIQRTFQLVSTINAQKTTSAVSTYAIVDYICNARYVFVYTKTLATSEK